MTAKIKSTVVVIAALLAIQLTFGHRRINVASTLVGVFWLLAAATIAFWPSLRRATRVLGVTAVVVLATAVAEAASNFRLIRLTLAGSLPWTEWLGSTLFTAAVEAANIALVLGAAWLLASLVHRLNRKQAT